MGCIGDRFQQETKYSPRRRLGRMLVWEERPALYKEYSEAPKVDLPAFEPTPPMSLDQALRRRTSIRNFGLRPVSKAQLSYLLWASTGIQRVEHEYEFRTAPSAGALYPIETYVVVNTVGGLEKGLYHYAIKHHQLEQLMTGDLRGRISAAALGQGFCASAAAVFVWSAVFDRCKWKYDQRAYRYIYLDAGHIAENLALAAVSLNLGSCQIGALFDDEVNRILGIDGISEGVIYMAVVGWPG
jgi:SagB-type dehydrogenase family enzyme